jgi:hypothetical protein
MKQSERRHSENAQLREKIDQIQEASQRLQALTTQIQAQTLEFARSGKIDELPDAALAKNLSHLLHAQSAALAQVQNGIQVDPIQKAARISSALISDAEFSALMK